MSFTTLLINIKFIATTAIGCRVKKTESILAIMIAMKKRSHTPRRSTADIVPLMGANAAAPIYMAMIDN